MYLVLRENSSGVRGFLHQNDKPSCILLDLMDLEHKGKGTHDCKVKGKECMVFNFFLRVKI